MTTINTIIDDILKREGGYSDNPADRGGRTDKGISRVNNPEAWADGQVTEAEAREIYLQKYVVGPGFSAIPPSHQTIQAQLIDFAVNSGPMVAIQKLQFILGLPVDGIFGPNTLSTLVSKDPRIVGNQLAIQRIKMIARIVSKTPSQLRFLGGWINRSSEFIV